MKKRLKNLLALCMVAMMMFAMSTGVVSAETYYAHMPDGGVKQYITDKNHGNDSRTLYKGIPDNVTIAMNPGDVIVPLELTGASTDPDKPKDANGKYDDFCGQPFFIVKYVAKDNLDNDYETNVLNPALSDKYKDENKLTGGVYLYDNSWNDCKITLKLYIGNSVDIKKMNGEKGNVAIQEWQEPSNDEKELMKAELEKFKFYDVAYDENGIVQWAKPKSIEETELLKRNGGKTVNGFMRTNIEIENSYKTICSALKLPNCANGLGYHYNVKKISASEWDTEYGRMFPQENSDDEPTVNVNNTPTGIKPLEGESEVNYNNLIDTIFTYKQNKDDTSQYFYENQINIGLEITEAPNTYTINFDSNGGEGTMDSIDKKTYNSSDNKLPKNNFTKTGYKFVGWKIKEATYPDTIYQYDKYKNEMDKDPGKENEKLIKDDLKSIKIDTTKAPYQELYEDEAEYIPGNHNETVTLEAQWEEVVVPADEPTTPDDTSSTGDNMNITLLMALLLLSGCGIAGAGLYRRNHVK